MMTARRARGRDARRTHAISPRRDHARDVSHVRREVHTRPGAAAQEPAAVRHVWASGTK